jgi:hypothetical protein
MRLLDHLGEILGKDARVDGRGLDRAVAVGGQARWTTVESVRSRWA